MSTRHRKQRMPSMNAQEKCCIVAWGRKRSKTKPFAQPTDERKTALSDLSAACLSQEGERFYCPRSYCLNIRTSDSQHQSPTCRQKNPLPQKRIKKLLTPSGNRITRAKYRTMVRASLAALGNRRNAKHRGEPQQSICLEWKIQKLTRWTLQRNLGRAWLSHSRTNMTHCRA